MAEIHNRDWTYFPLALNIPERAAGISRRLMALRAYRQRGMAVP
jgi:hypothetical protein